jgi:nucleotide-binding universal stress UspA family protein
VLAIKIILHPTDFSEPSDFAFRQAYSRARDYGARLVVLHVAKPFVAVAGERVMMLPPATDLEPLRDPLQQLRPQDPKTTVEHRLAQGDTAAEILQTAQDTNCDVIVMGTHGRTGLDRLLMGSVAEQVVRRATCPVLTVKTPLCQVPPLGGARFGKGR